MKRFLQFILIFLIQVTSGIGQNNSLHFDGVNDNVVGPSDPLFELIDGTVELWIKPTFDASSQTFLCYRSSDGLQTRYLWNFTGGLSGLGFWNGSSYITISHSFNADQWYHLAFVDDGTGTKTYVDGMLIGTFVTQFGTASGSSLNLVLGYDIPLSEYFGGEMDEIRIWDIPLSQQDIQNQMDCELNGTEDCLVVYYQFNQGDPGGDNSGLTNLEDASTNNFDCTLNNFALNGNTSNWLASGNGVSGSCPMNSCTPPPPLLYSIQPYYLITTDHVYSQVEYDTLVNTMLNIQAWYQVATGGMTFNLDLPIEIVNLPNDSAYYNANGYWQPIIDDLVSMNYSPFEATKINIYFIKGGGRVALGGQGCGVDCGVAMVGMDIFPEFDTGVYGECPEGEGAGAWPCTPKGAAGHELGHCFGLPHPFDDPSTNQDAHHSLMQTHWNYPYIYASAPDRPWSLLTLERQVLHDNPFFYEDIPLTQPYEELPVLNLPLSGTLPSADFSYSANGLTITFTNNSTDNDLNYWTFGDGQVSNELNPTHIFPDYGSYTVILRVSNTDAMMDSTGIEILLDIPLPLDLLRFSGKATDNSIILNWQTANEIDFSHFEIEKSIDGKYWKLIGERNGTSATIEKQHYIFEDREPFFGDNYYRLRLVDLDTSFSYSDIIQLKFNSNVKDIVVYPNPAKTQLFFSSSSNIEVDNVLIFNRLGQLVLSGIPEDNSLNVSSLNSGVYFIEITNGDIIINKKVIIK